MNDSSSNVDKTRIALIAIAVALALGIGAVIYFLTANNNSPSQTDYEESKRTNSTIDTSSASSTSINTTENDVPKGFDSYAANKQLLVKELRISDNEFALKIKNLTDDDLDITFDVLFFNESNQLIDEGDYPQKGIGAGEVFINYYYLDDNYDHVSYTASTEMAFLDPAKISMETVSVSDYNTVLSITNEGEYACSEPTIHALFYKDNKLVDYKRIDHSMDSPFLQAGDSTEFIVPIDSIDRGAQVEYIPEAGPYSNYID